MDEARPVDLLARDETRGGRLALLMLGGGFGALLLAGGLLWWRDGELLFTEGLISAIARCF